MKQKPKEKSSLITRPGSTSDSKKESLITIILGELRGNAAPLPEEEEDDILEDASNSPRMEGESEEDYNLRLKKEKANGNRPKKLSDAIGIR